MFSGSVGSCISALQAEGEASPSPDVLSHQAASTQIVIDVVVGQIGKQ